MFRISLFLIALGLASCSSPLASREVAQVESIIPREQAISMAGELLSEGGVVFDEDYFASLDQSPVATTLSKSIQLVHGHYPYVKPGDDLGKQVWIIYMNGDYQTVNLATGEKLVYKHFSVVLDAHSGALSMLTGIP